MQSVHYGCGGCMYSAVCTVVYSLVCTGVLCAVCSSVCTGVFLGVV